MSQDFVVRLFMCGLLSVSALSCTAECSEKESESFDFCLPRFSSEKPFAIERTRLPLTVLKWVDELDIEGRTVTEPFKYALSLSEYWHWPTLNEYMSSNELNSRVIATSKTAVILDLYKDGYAKTVSYRFESSNGCWFLTQYQDKPI